MYGDQENRRVDKITRLEERRRSIRKILGVGGAATGSAYLSGKWVTPVVESVVLPAHAQTTGAFSLFDPCGITVVCISSGNFQVNVDGSVLPATAGVNVRLDFLMLNGAVEMLTDSTLATTNGAGAYSTSITVGPIVVTEIVVTATLVDFPEADPASCSISHTDPGEHAPYSYYNYFCQSVPSD